MKLPTYKQLWRMLKIAALIITAIGLECYFYFAPRFNHGVVDYVLFHPPDRRIDNEIEIAGIVGKHFKISSINFAR